MQANWLEGKTWIPIQLTFRKARQEKDRKED
jgi:hypothetical protein